jgi:ankyrin repeat protein
MNLAGNQPPTQAEIETAMARAVRLGNVPQAEELLKYFGADANATVGGHPLVTLAVKLKKSGMAGLLLQAGADPNAVNPEGESAAEVAIKSFQAQNLRLLLQHGANVSHRNAAQETPGDIINKGWQAAVAAEKAEQYRKEEKKLVTDKWTRLAIALALDPNEKVQGVPAIILAVRMKDPEGLKDLIAAGADLSATTPDGDSALMLAVRDQNAGHTALLLEAGANPHQADIKGETPAAVALKATLSAMKQEKICEYYERESLQKKVAEREALALSIISHPSYTAAGDAADSALPLASVLKNRSAFDRLLEKGVPITAATKDGNCMLHFAVLYGRQDMVEEAVSKGASLLQVNKERQTPLGLLEAIFESETDSIAARKEKRRITEEAAAAELAAWQKLKLFLTDLTGKDTDALSGELSQTMAVRNKPFKLKSKAPAS